MMNFDNSNIDNRTTTRRKKRIHDIDDDIDDEFENYTNTADDSWLDEFFFQQRHGKLNIRQISRLDLNQIVEKVDIVALHNVLENIAFCNLKVGDLDNISDPMIIKTFRIAQLIIEYMINLENSLYTQNDRLQQSETELFKLVKQLQKDNQIIADENDSLRKEIKQKRKALATFEYVLTVHGPNGSAIKEILKEKMPRNNGKGSTTSHLEACVCATCGKAFSSREFLS